MTCVIFYYLALLFLVEREIVPLRKICGMCCRRRILPRSHLVLRLPGVSITTTTLYQ
jgi:hypothetical protein